MISGRTNNNRSLENYALSVRRFETATRQDLKGMVSVSREELQSFSCNCSDCKGLRLTRAARGLS